MICLHVRRLERDDRAVERCRARLQATLIVRDLAEVLTHEAVGEPLQHENAGGQGATGLVPEYFLKPGPGDSGRPDSLVDLLVVALRVLVIIDAATEPAGVEVAARAGHLVRQPRDIERKVIHEVIELRGDTVDQDRHQLGRGQVGVQDRARVFDLEVATAGEECDPDQGQPPAQLHRVHAHDLSPRLLQNATRTPMITVLGGGVV